MPSIRSLTVSFDMNFLLFPRFTEKANAHDAQGPEVDVEALVVTATGTIVNPPNAAIGRKPSVADLAAWKQTTIFGPL